jgi:hypothetical protein
LISVLNCRIAVSNAINISLLTDYPPPPPVNQRLKQDVLTFVNTVAEIVHTSVHYWGGQCNKNLGNAFVIIWRIGDEDTLLQQTMFSNFGMQKTRNSLEGGLEGSPEKRLSSIQSQKMNLPQSHRGSASPSPSLAPESPSPGGAGSGSGAGAGAGGGAGGGPVSSPGLADRPDRDSPLTRRRTESVGSDPVQGLEESRLARRKKAGHVIDLKKVPGHRLPR